MAVLASIAGAALVVSKFTILPALVYVVWRGAASPVTLWLLTWAGSGVLIDQLLITDRRMKPYEGAALGAATAVLISLRGGIPLVGGR